MPVPNLLSLKIEFGGGLELLFSNQRSHRLSIPARVPIQALAPSAPSTVGLSSQDNASTITGEDAATSSEDIASKPADVQFLIFYLRDHLLKERPELFVEDNTVRPGILVLINDTDWELEGEGSYQLQDGDEVVFISTLHGG